MSAAARCLSQLRSAVLGAVCGLVEGMEASGLEGGDVAEKVVELKDFLSKSVEDFLTFCLSVCVRLVFDCCSLSLR